MRYNYYQAKNKVICVSSFAKKNVRGVAICADEDSFDFEIGANLARLRCDKSIAEKRVKSATRKLKKAQKALEEAYKNVEYFESYLYDSSLELDEVNYALAEFEGRLNG